MPAAFIPPAASCELPPTIGIFSSIITFLPLFNAVIAAVKPVAPVPTTTISVFSTLVGLALAY